MHSLKVSPKTRSSIYLVLSAMAMLKLCWAVTAVVRLQAADHLFGGKEILGLSMVEYILVS